MSFLKINQIEQSADSLTYFYSNAPVTWFVILFTIFLVGAISIKNLKFPKKPNRRSKGWEHWTAEYGVPVLCGVIIIAITYHSNRLVVSQGSDEMVWKDRNFFTYLTPDTKHIKIAAIEAIRVGHFVIETKSQGETVENERSNWVVSLELQSGEKVEVWANSGRDLDKVKETADQLAKFIQYHPAFEGLKLSILSEV